MSVRDHYLIGSAVLAADLAPSALDRAAAVCHDQWRHWAGFMLAHPEEEPRWRQLLQTEFADLADYDKDADRRWAERVLAAARGA